MYREPAVSLEPVTLPGDKQIPPTGCPFSVRTIQTASGHRIMALMTYCNCK